MRIACLKIFSLLFLVSTAAFVIFLHQPDEQTVSSFGPDGGQKHTLILDAGHGGEDGGAISPHGLVESDLNLLITKKLDQLAGFYGLPCVLLRNEDISLHDSSAMTLREKKVSDLRNRVSAIQNVSNGVLISIHQNTYADSRYRGAQVFYSNAALSEEWAVSTQNSLRAALDQNNQRSAKVIPDSIYLMNHISCPALLIECGFLSNPEDESLLQTEQYQRKLALALVSAYLNYELGQQGGQFTNESKNVVLLYGMRQ